MTKIVYFDVKEYEYEYLKSKNEGKYDYCLISEPLNDSFEVTDIYRDADIISVFTTSRVTKEVLKQFKKLKLIALRSVGFNHIDTKYCKKHNIVIVNSLNYGSITVAEFSLGLLLDVSRKITASYNEYKNGKICPHLLIGSELYDKTIGIVGLGAIGRAFAKIVHGLGMNILAYDIKEDEELKNKYGIEYTDFNSLIRNSDFISIHTPLTKQNYHMFTKDVFQKMKKTAIIINTGRGEIIDTQALYNALVTGEIAGAGLDVLENEETVSDFDYMLEINRVDKNILEKTVINTKLFQLDNVVITPHVAYNTQEAITRILATTMDNIDSFCEGIIKNRVNHSASN